MVILLKIKRRDFFQLDSIPIFVSRTVKIGKFKLLYFRNKTSYGNGDFYKDLIFVYLQPTVNKNSCLAILTLGTLRYSGRGGKEDVGLPEKVWSDDAATLAGKTN